MFIHLNPTSTCQEIEINVPVTVLCTSYCVDPHSLFKQTLILNINVLSIRYRFSNAFLSVTKLILA